LLGAAAGGVMFHGREFVADDGVDIGDEGIIAAIR
jgi:hypothetical protein